MSQLGMVAVMTVSLFAGCGSSADSGTASDGAEAVTDTQQQEQTAEGVSTGGLHWRFSSLWLAPEQYGWASPMYLGAFSIEGTDEEHLNITVVYAGQASGKYFEPFLAKALENAEREAAK